MPHPDEILGLALPSQRAAAAITVAASPFSFVARTSGAVIVNAGTVSLVEIGRNGTFTTIGVVAGMFHVAQDDTLRVTYTVAPTMTFLRF
jgi:hypothetical protein